jgi:hypothetical protein
MTMRGIQFGGDKLMKIEKYYRYKNRDKKDVFTLDLLLTKRPYHITSKEETTRTTPSTDSNKNFEIRDFMKHYSREPQTRDPQFDKNKLTLEDLQAARRNKPVSFFIKNTREEDDY